MVSAARKSLSAKKSASAKKPSSVKKPVPKRSAKKVSYAMKQTGTSRARLVKIIGTMLKQDVLEVALPHIECNADESDTKKVLLRKLYAAGDEAVVAAYKSAVKDHNL